MVIPEIGEKFRRFEGIVPSDAHVTQIEREILYGESRIDTLFKTLKTIRV